MSRRAPQATGAAPRGAEDGARAAAIRRSAWWLAGLAVFFYVGFMVWTLIKGQLLGP
jgi:hypothetical protein